MFPENPSWQIQTMIAVVGSLPLADLDIEKKRKYSTYRRGITIKFAIRCMRAHGSRPFVKFYFLLLLNEPLFNSPPWIREFLFQDI